jgi:hypothetical protein
MQKANDQVQNTLLQCPMMCLFAWIVGCIAWNVVGVILVARGGPGIGPTASLPLAGGLAAVALLLWLAAKKSLLLFSLLGGLCGLAGLAAVIQAITGDPSAWPSPFWRWAGAALNAGGALAGIFAVARGLGAKRI